MPSAIAIAALRITQRGGSAPGARVPAVISVSVMMPIVFCASFVPCANDMSAADAIWPTLKPLSVTDFRARFVSR